ncbi:MAG TPA: hypothetical protein VF645_05620 [Allosphingosinicella sp.]|jgi:hypothetical protein
MRTYAILLMTALGGCTTTSLNTRPMAQTAPNGAAGMRYALPALQYKTTVSRRLTECAVRADGALDVDFEVNVEADPEMVDGEWFAVDYRDLGSWSKTSAFDMETYENQTLKSFNAEADDQGPEIAAGVIKAGFSIARLAAGLPGSSAAPAGGSVVPLAEDGPAPAAQRPKILVCPNDLLTRFKRLKAALEAKTGELEDAVAELEPWVVEGLLGTLTDDDKKKISGLRTKIRALSLEITDIREEMDDHGERLSWIEIFEFLPRWGRDGKGLDHLSTFPSAEASKMDAQLNWTRRLFGTDFDEADLADLGTKMGPVALAVRASESGNAGAICGQAGVKPGCEVPPTPKWNNFVSATADARPMAVPGVAYRTPARGRLRICRKIGTAECAVGTAPTMQIYDGIELFPQLGRLGILPFENGFGQNNQLSATFRPDGSIERASYSEKRARGRALVDVVNGGLDQALTFSQAVRDKRKADREAAEGAAAAELDRQITLATKQRDLAALEGSAQLARTNSEIAQLNAEKTLRELRDELSGGTD